MFMCISMMVPRLVCVLLLILIISLFARRQPAGSLEDVLLSYTSYDMISYASVSHMLLVICYYS